MLVTLTQQKFVVRSCRTTLRTHTQSVAVTNLSFLSDATQVLIFERNGPLLRRFQIIEFSTFYLFYLNIWNSFYSILKWCSYFSKYKCNVLFAPKFNIYLEISPIYQISACYTCGRQVENISLFFIGQNLVSQNNFLILHF